MYVFNVFLFFAFLGNRPFFDAMTAGGATCYVWRGDGLPDSEAPPCPY